MKSTPTNPVRSMTTWPAARTRWTYSLLAVALLLFTVSTTLAQTVQFRSSVVRVTVPVNSSSSTLITNLVDVGGLVDPVNFDVSDLPVGATYNLTDTNNSPLFSTADDTELWLTINTTNVAEGVYNFSLNGSGGAVNSIHFILQVGHFWTNTFNASGLWSVAGNWIGGVPTSSSEVIFGDLGAQTNQFTGIGFTNSIVDVNTTIGSLRFAQTIHTNANTTNSLLHTIQINANTTLSVVGTNGFSILRDYLDDLTDGSLQRTLDVNFVGGAGSRLVVSNAAANISMIVGAQLRPSLNMSNLPNFTAYVSRIGLADSQLQPFYGNYNYDNVFGSNPRRIIANVSLPRTNVITAIYKDADNYTNEFTRSYALSYSHNEQYGVGSSVPSFLNLGQSNAFFVDSVGFGRANNGGDVVRFNPGFANSTALFRSTNNGRLSMFAVADNAGTNVGASNLKAVVDFGSGNGTIDLLVDRLYIARDRTLYVSNATCNIQGDFIIGKGTVDANNAIFGYQEHTGQTNWYAIDPSSQDNRYFGWCEGRVFVTNGATLKINNTLTLGYTADTNDVNAAQQYFTYGQITLTNGSTLMASNLVVDGGLNFYNNQGDTHGRANRISANGSTVIITNTLGALPGLPLDQLTLENSTLTVHNASPTRTNAYVRLLQTPGTTPSVIRIASLSGVTSYPVQVPIISYESASSPFLTANVSALGAGFVGYVLDNIPNKTVDVYITTNPPNSLVWRGLVNSNWDGTTKNWITTVGSFQTNFSIGDSVTFDDGTANTNIMVIDAVVPGQAGTGVTFNNSTRSYTLFGGTIAGTALMVKNGTGALTINATKQGPININAGTVNGGGTIGLANVATNAVLNYSGLVNGGLTSTGSVTIASGGMLVGPMTIRGGVFVNSGVVTNISTALTVSGKTLMTNTASGQMNMVAGNWSVSEGSTLANFGTIYNTGGRLNLGSAAAPFDGGLLFGTGEIQDPDGTPLVPPFPAAGADGRITINNVAVISPGAQPINSIGTLTAKARFDFNNNLGSPPAQMRIEVDFNNAQTNDIIIADRWNNIAGMLLMTNINPGAGSFANGHVFQVFKNSNGDNFPNQFDVNGTYPLMWPPVPGPGLQWGLADFRTWGRVSVTNTSLIWNGTGSGTWDTNSSANNWKSGQVYSDNLGAQFDDTAVGTTTILLTNIVSPNGSVASTNPIFSPGIVFNNTTRDYTIGGTGKISGITGFLKTGSGTLTILTSNDFTGNVYIEGGTVAITNILGLGTTLSGANASQAYMNGSTLSFIGNTNVTFGRALVFNPSGATIDVAFATNEFTINTSITGPGTLTKTGPGTVVLNQTGDAYTGTIINSGPLRLSAAAAGSGSITLPNSSATLQLTNSFTFTNTINVTGAGTTIRVLSNSLPVSGGVWTGGGGVTISNASLFVFNSPLSGFSGTISFGNSLGTFRFNNATNANACTGSTAATFDFGTGTASLSNHNGGALTYDLGALAGGANTILAGRSSNTTSWAAGTVYSIGANGSNTTFSGKIVNGQDTVSIIKVGSSTLALNGINTYTGPTTVSAGKLGGTGSVASPVTVALGGTLSPGASVGTFAISNSLTLAGTTAIEVSRNAGVLTSDKIVGLTSVAYGGTLAITNVGPDALIAGDSFQIFNLGGTGNFTNIVSTLPPPLSWSFNPATGLLTVVGQQSPTLNVGQVGNALQFSWTNTGTNLFKLQAQTNNINVGLSTNWFNYPGGGTSPVSVTINPANPSVFFRLSN